MDVEYALLADGVGARPDGKMDIFGAGVDTIWAPSAPPAPATHAQLALIMAFSVSRHEAEAPHRIDVFILGADGEEIGRAHGDIAPVAQDQLEAIAVGRRVGIRNVLVFGGLTFPEFGLYHFAIHWDGNEARPPIVVSLQHLEQQNE